MAVKAFTIVVRLIEGKLCRHRLEVINVEMPEPAELGLYAAKHRVIGVTGIAGFISRDAIILEMRGGNIGWIIDAQTFSVSLHRMAG